MLGQLWDLSFWVNPRHWHWIFKVKDWNRLIMGIGGPIDIERNRCELIIDDHDHDVCVTMLGWVDVPHSDRVDLRHYSDVIKGSIASQITSLTIVYSTVYSGTDQRKHQSVASLAFEWGIHRGPVNSPHKGPVTRKLVPFDDVIMDVAVLSTKHILSIYRHLLYWSSLLLSFLTRYSKNKVNIKNLAYTIKIQ